MYTPAPHHRWSMLLQMLLQQLWTWPAKDWWLTGEQDSCLSNTFEPFRTTVLQREHWLFAVNYQVVFWGTHVTSVSVQRDQIRELAICRVNTRVSIWQWLDSRVANCTGSASYAYNFICSGSSHARVCGQRYFLLIIYSLRLFFALNLAGLMSVMQRINLS